MKQYTIQGHTVQLATPTPKRLSGFCACLGLKSLGDLEDKEKSVEIGKAILDFTIDEKRLTDLMLFCTSGGQQINWTDVELDTVNEVFSDFFTSVVKSYMKAAASMHASRSTIS